MEKRRDYSGEAQNSVWVIEKSTYIMHWKIYFPVCPGVYLKDSAYLVRVADDKDIWRKRRWFRKARKVLEINNWSEVIYQPSQIYDILEP